MTAVERWMAQVLSGAPAPSPAESTLNEIAAAAAAHGVTTLLHRATGELADESRRATAVDIARGAELERVFDAFDRDRVRAVVTKGEALARTLYPASALRARTDTDLLVADRAAAAQTLTSLGYALVPNAVGEHVIRQQLWRRLDRVRHDVDLHFALSNRARFADALPFDELYARGSAMREHVRAISHADALLHAAIHLTGHHSGEERLIWYFDIHLLVQRLGSEGVAAVMRFARERGCARELDETLARTRAWFGGEPQPRREISPLAILADDFRSTRGIAARAALVKEHLVPSAEHVMRRYGARHRALLPVYYARRAAAAVWREVTRAKMRRASNHQQVLDVKSKPIVRWGRKA
jgi:hypothetical protein